MEPPWTDTLLVGLLALQELDAQLLLKHAADIDCKDATMGWTALHYAVASHNITAAKQVRRSTRQK
jgi:ankyrin repeat protein